MHIGSGEEETEIETDSLSECEGGGGEGDTVVVPSILQSTIHRSPISELEKDELLFSDQAIKALLVDNGLTANQKPLPLLSSTSLLSFALSLFSFFPFRVI